MMNHPERYDSGLPEALTKTQSPSASDGPPNTQSPSAREGPQQPPQSPSASEGPQQPPQSPSASEGPQSCSDGKVQRSLADGSPTESATFAYFIDVVIPVLNEAHVLARSVATVRHHLSVHLPYRWRIVIVDNGSTDSTAAVARSLTARHDDVAFLSLARRGRGQALRHAWLQSEADAVCYMDVDLSTDLAFLRPLLRAVLEEGYAVSTGSRLLPQSRTRRSLQRELISRAYNLTVRAALRVSFSDAQCGFKALSRAAVHQLVPLIEDESWFFDTELLFLAELHRLPIRDIPVVWNEDDDSRVKIVRTALDDLKGIWRLRRTWLNGANPRPA